MAKHGRQKLPPSKLMSRKEKRKAERKLKKQRKEAYTQRNFALLTDLKTVDTAFKAKRKKEREERLQKKKENKKVIKKEEKKERQQQVEDARLQGLRLAIKKDERELKELEKNLKFRKKKGKTALPSSFTNDGLDYILDATDSEKIKSFDDALGSLDNLEHPDSESDSEEDIEMNDLSEESESEEPSKWDPSAKAAKSILKVEGKGKKKKNVMFEANDTETDSDPFEDQFSDIDFDQNEAARSASEEDGSELSVDEKEGKSEGDDAMHSDDQDEYDEKDNRRNMSDGDDDDDNESKSDDQKSDLKEDIYGRLRDSAGNVVTQSGAGGGGSYIPPARRALMAGGADDQLRKKLKGLLNRVSEGAMQVISSSVEALYLENSRGAVNAALTSLTLEALVTPTLAPERIVSETAMLHAVLHSNVGTEIGAFCLQAYVEKFQELLQQSLYGGGKLMENVVMLISGLYNFKIVHSKLIFDIMDKFVGSFHERDIELILLLLKTVGFSLRKDDPARLKTSILAIQEAARALEANAADSSTSIASRVKFMLDVLTAVRNNNMRKIPSYDPSHTEHLRKVVKGFLKGEPLGGDQLSVSLSELLSADRVGRWWIVGSAWQGRDADRTEAKSKTETSLKDVGGISKQMLRLARQQGMNTDIRRHIFCILGTSEDFEDAFATLLRLGLNRSQEREIIHVLLHCCLNEKDYNPYYSYLAQKFCAFDRRFTMTVQFSMWDKFKEVDQMPSESRIKLGKFIAHLLLHKGLSLSIFKVVEFGMESKKMIRLLTAVLGELLSHPSEATVMDVFTRIAPFPKLKPLRQGLQVFMRVHLRGKTARHHKLQERADKAEAAMFSHQTSHSLL